MLSPVPCETVLESIVTDVSINEKKGLTTGILISGEIRLTVLAAASSSEAGGIAPQSSSLVISREDQGALNEYVARQKTKQLRDGEKPIFGQARAVDPAQIVVLSGEKVALLLQALGLLEEE